MDNYKNIDQRPLDQSVLCTDQSVLGLVISFNVSSVVTTDYVLADHTELNIIIISL
jgi:hypothetical protein